MKATLIAEIGQAHDGSIGILHSYIDAIATTGVDVIKFQTHIAEAESSIKEPFRTNFSYEDATRFDYWKRMSFTESQWKEIKAHCDSVGLEFMSSPFSVAAVELLESIDIKRYKIGSGEVSNLLMLERIKETKKPIILSSGMSSFSELRSTLDFLTPYEASITILQCTTAYPTPAERLGLNVIPLLQSGFTEVNVGYSDHSGSIYPCIAARTLGATVLEFHAVFDKNMFGPDARSSLTIDQISSLVDGVRMVEKSLSNPVDKDQLDEYKGLKKIFEKSLAVSRDLSKGHVIQLEDLESKKPANEGIPACDFQSVIGKSLINDKKKYDFLDFDDIK